MRIPYEDTQVSVSNTQGAIRELLQKYDAQSFGFMENFENKRLMIRFKYKNLPVQIEVAWGKYFEMLQNKYNKPDDVLQRKAQRAVLRALFYWLKSNFEFMELGIIDFEDIFMSHFMQPNGSTLGNIIKDKLPSFTTGQLLIGE